MVVGRVAGGTVVVIDEEDYVFCRIVAVGVEVELRTLVQLNNCCVLIQSADVLALREEHY